MIKAFRWWSRKKWRWRAKTYTLNIKWNRGKRCQQSRPKKKKNIVAAMRAIVDKSYLSLPEFQLKNENKLLFIECQIRTNATQRTKKKKKMFAAICWRLYVNGMRVARWILLPFPMPFNVTFCLACRISFVGRKINVRQSEIKNWLQTEIERSEATPPSKLANCFVLKS